MNKHQSLHDYFHKQYKEHLISWVENATPNYIADGLDDGYQVKYSSKFLFSAISQDSNILAKVVFFLAQYEPERTNLEVAQPVINIDVVDNKIVDVLLEVDFVEIAKPVPNDNGFISINDVKHNIKYQGFTPLSNLDHTLELVYNEKHCRFACVN